MKFYPFRVGSTGAYGPVTERIKGRLHDRAKMARIRQKLERFQQFLERNSELLSVPRRVHRRLWTQHGTDKTSLFLCKTYWNRSSFCRIRAIFALSCKRPLKLHCFFAKTIGTVPVFVGSVPFLLCRVNAPLVHKVLTPKMKKKMGVTDFVPEKMAVENALISINRS